MEWGEDLVNQYGVHRPWWYVDQALSKQTLLLLDFGLGLYSLAIL